MSHIIIADSHVLYRDALCRFMHQADKDLQITDCGEYDQLVNFCTKQPPDLILVASDFPGLEMVPFKNYKTGLMARGPDMPKDVNSFAGIFPRTLSSKDIIAGIKTILQGQKFMPNVSIVSAPAPAPKNQGQSIHSFGLSPREKEVLSHLVKGASNKDIARALDLQVVTIKLHVRGICRKLGASNRTQAALMAKECGWI